MKKEVVEWIKSLLFAIIVVYVIQLFFAVTVVHHTSMKNTLMPGDVVLLYKTKSVDRYDVITFKSNIPLTESDKKEIPFYKRIFVGDNSKKSLAKRIIGMPNDKLLIDGENVYINDELIEEKYISSVSYDTVSYDKIPEDYYFVMGDNRAISLDSRDQTVGLVHKDDIVGKLILRIYPFNTMGKVKNE